MKRDSILSATLLAGLCLVGTLASGTRPAHAQKAPAAGKITGVISFKGEAPKRVPLKRDTDPECAKTPKLSEDIVVTKGKLRDVHVRIKIGTAGKHKVPAEPATVNQVECMYTPRVIGVIEGQKVAIRNGDATYHNVRGIKEDRTDWNLGQPAQAPAIVREKLGKAGDVVTLRCDVHPWMRAYAVVTDHPYFDVTEANGAFSIDNVPPGEYTLEAWHPVLGQKSVPLTVRKGQSATVDFSFP